MKKTIAWILWIVLFGLLAAVPVALSSYYVNIVVLVAIFALYALSLNLILGFTGLLSFGHALFFGGGAYAAALALTHVEGLPLIPAILIGGLFSMALALVLSLLLVRVSGTAFCMLTLALAQIMYIFCSKFREITGGEDGLSGYPTPAFTIPGVVSWDMMDSTHFYYFAMVFVCVCVWVLWYFTKTPLGSVMVGIRDNSKRVDYLGFKVPHTKAIIFAVSGLFAGFAGGLFAIQQNLVSIDGVLSSVISFSPIMMAFIGGAWSFFGPIYGAVFLTVIGELVNKYISHVELVTGIIFILTIIYAPYGIAGIFRFISLRWLTKRTPAVEEGTK